MPARDKYEILVQIRDQIAGLDRTIDGLQQGRHEAREFADELRQGFAIGIGNEVVRQITMMPRRIGAMTDSLVDARLEMDAIRGRLDFVAGDQAQALWEHLRRKADKYGQSLQTISDQYGKVKVAADLANFSAAETEVIFDGILSAATVLSFSNDQVYGSFKALTDIMSKGTVTAEDLKEQLGDRLPGAIGLAAKAMDMSTQELLKMMSTGQILAKDLLPALGRELQKTFGPQVQARAGQLRGQMHRLNNEWFQMKLALGDGGVIDAYTDTMADLLEIAKDKDFQQGLKEIAAGIGEIAKMSAEALKQVAPLFAEFASAAPMAINFFKSWLSGKNAKAVNTPFGTMMADHPGEDLFDAFVQTFVLRGKGSGSGAATEPPKLEIVAEVGAGSGGSGKIGPADMLRSELTNNGMELDSIVRQRAVLEMDPLVPLVDKQRELVDLLEKELYLRIEQNSIRSRILNEDDTLDDDARLKLLEEMQGDSLNIANIDAMMIRLGEFSQGFQSAMVDWVDSFGTTAEQVASIVTGTLQSAIDGIAESIDGLIFGTMTWGEAFANVGQQILRTIIQLVVQFIAQQLIMLAMRKMFGSQMLGIASGEATALSSMWATPATLASIASYGAAAGIGAAAVLGAVGVTTGIAAGISAGAGQAGGIAGFADGGLVTGPGGPRSDAILARLSNMEYVMPADKTARYLPMLEAMRRGDNMTIGEMAAQGGRGPTATEILVATSIAEAMEMAADRSGLVTIREMEAVNRKRV